MVCVLPILARGETSQRTDERCCHRGGTPVTEPKLWYDVKHCSYETPNDPFVATILQQNVQGERCAIGYYKRVLDLTQGKYPVTYNMVLQILQDEVAHEEDLQSLAEDLEFMLKK
ncbi:MAG TPA: ferritin-like domain-containing protein [Anaerolineae bacterium]|nr:ferritin-like domain-containing protein [Anaerolineae bacterium]